MVNFNPIYKKYFVRWQSDLVNTIESILPVCHKPYHKIKENLPHWGGGLKLCGTMHYKRYMNILDMKCDVLNTGVYPNCNPNCQWKTHVRTPFNILNTNLNTNL